MKTILVTGLNFKTATVEMRERLSFSFPEIKKGLEKLISNASVEECLILSTCNRTEIYTVTEDIEACMSDIRKFLSDFHCVPADEFASCLYNYCDGDAVIHLFRVASGVDSMIVGEPQILGQAKRAYNIASRCGTTGVILHRLFHTAFFTGKKVRTETGIGRHAVSVSYAAVELSRKIFGDAGNLKIMLVGAGEASEQAARHFVRYGAGEFIICTRSADSSRRLAEKLNAHCIEPCELGNNLNKVDIVITATGSSGYIINRGHFNHVPEKRKRRSVLLIDLSVPRDIDPEVKEFPDIHLYNVDDLRDVLDQNMKLRSEKVKHAENLITHSVMSFLDWMGELKVVPVITELVKLADEIGRYEAENACRKLGNITEREKNIINKMAQVITRKILHHPIVNIKKASSVPAACLYVETIKRLFDLDSSLDSIS